MRARAAFVFFLAALATGVAVAAPAKLVYRIDRAAAAIENNRLVIVARGAVSTGGWMNPRLRLRETSGQEANTLEVEFVATPPRRRAAVAQAILPVSARIKARRPYYGVVQVKVVSQTNIVTVPITHLSSRNGNGYAASATTRFRPVFLAR